MERLKNYEAQTLPLSDYYGMKKRLVEIDGSIGGRGRDYGGSAQGN